MILGLIILCDGKIKVMEEWRGKWLWDKGRGPREVLLIRHGETDFNALGVVQGWWDTFLNTKGLKQAKYAAAVLKDYPIDVMFTSPLKRAWQTAWVIHQYHRNIPLIKTELLKERGLGKLSGHHIHEGNKLAPTVIVRREYEKIKGWVRDLELEAQEAFKDRVKKFWLRFITTYPIDNKVIAVITHGGVIRVSLRLFEVKVPDSWKPMNAGVIKITPER